nr:helix-turn-helix domain-containing protein [uncultured Trichococcus sp.]
MVQIGEILKSARLSKGYTLDDLQQMTKIQKRYLIAIEEGNFEIMPGNFYVRAFIKQYADTVGLDGDRLLGDHASVIPEIQGSSQVEDSGAFSPTRSETKRASKKTNFNYGGSVQSQLPTFLLAVAVVAIVLVVWKATLNNDDEQVQIEVASTITQTTMASQETVSSSTEQTDSDSITEQATQVTLVSFADGYAEYDVTSLSLPSELKISAVAGGSSWISVSVNGAVQEPTGIVNGENPLTITLPVDASVIEVIVGVMPATIIEMAGTVVTMPADYQEIQTQTLSFTVKGAE